MSKHYLSIIIWDINIVQMKIPNTKFFTNGIFTRKKKVQTLTKILLFFCIKKILIIFSSVLEDLFYCCKRYRWISRSASLSSPQKPYKQ